MGMWGGGGGGGGWGGGGGMRGPGMGGGGGGTGMRRSDLMASDEDLGKAFDWKLMKRLVGYMAPYKRKASIGIAAMLIYQIANIMQVTIQGAAIDAVTAGNESRLMTIVAFYFVTLVVSWLGQYQQVYQMTWVGQHALYQVAGDMFNHIVRLSLSFFDRNETGRIMSRVQNDVTVLQNLLSSGIVSTIGNMLSLVVRHRRYVHHQREARPDHLLRPAGLRVNRSSSGRASRDAASARRARPSPWSTPACRRTSAACA